MTRSTSMLDAGQALKDLTEPWSVTRGSAGAMAGCLAAPLIATVCFDHIEECRSAKGEEELRGIGDRALSIRRDLLALVEQLDKASRAVREAERQPDRLRALLFASEVPLRTAESCHLLLNLSMKALGRVGVKGLGEIGTAASLAFAGVVGGIVTARAYLAGIPAGTGLGVGATRKRAERILREAEALRTQITDRVRQHLP
ncbi:MAG TPA: cyclodeaminase/cyclohydrolase family protein [Candidatus Polarisedimenticolia bacterium]|nr:cyclodeaminase/cyclohydrolase family protein [Candidatus Polarisedimenticolia bacterium]